MSNIYELLDQGQTLISDGAMGTMLQDAGLTDGGAPELWNVEHPDKVADILDQYAKNGANLLTTNTFSTLGVCLIASSTAGFKGKTAPFLLPPSEVITNFA